MTKTLLIETTDTKLKTNLTTKALDIASDAEVSSDLSRGVNNLIDSLASLVDDISTKKCSRCLKMGRMPYHPLEDFSLLKNGKYASQCKVCRTEQSLIWCQKRKEHRRAYHKEYAKRRTPVERLPKELRTLMRTYKVENKQQVKDALLVSKLE